MASFDHNVYVLGMLLDPNIRFEIGFSVEHHIKTSEESYRGVSETGFYTTLSRNINRFLVSFDHNVCFVDLSTTMIWTHVEKSHSHFIVKFSV